MRKFPFPRIHGPDHDLCIRSISILICAIISYNIGINRLTYLICYNRIGFELGNSVVAKRN